MSRSDSKVRDTNIRFRVSNNGENFRSRRSASMDKAIKPSLIPHRIRNSSEDRLSGLGLHHSSRWSNDARKSSISQSEGKISVKDPRPVSDKAYQKKKVTELLEVLERTQFSYPMTVSKLLSPTRKDYEMVYQHLVKVFDPNYEVKKIEEEAPKFLKSLSYPYIPNKQAFYHIARTSYPCLLGVLIYLMDLVKFILNLDRELIFKSSYSERPDEEALLLNYICDCHNCWESNDEKENDVFAKIASSSLPENLEKFQMEAENQRQDLEKLKRELEIREMYKKQYESKEYEIKMFEDYFMKMETHTKKKEDYIKTLLDSFSIKNKELQELQLAVANQQARYDAQGYDGKKQIVFFQEQQRELQEKLQQLKSELKDIQSECWEMEMQHAQMLDKGAVICEEFNRLSASVNDSASAICSALPRLKILENRNIDSLKLDQLLPPFHMTQSSTQAAGILRKNLEEAKSKLERTGIILKGLHKAQEQKLQEVLLRNSELSIKLKVVTVEENRKEHDLKSMDKQLLEEVKEIETRCEEYFKMLDRLQKEKAECEEDVLEWKEELAEYTTILKSHKKSFIDLKEKQKKFYAKCDQYCAEAEKFSEDQSKHIVDVFESYTTQLIRRYCQD